MRGCDESLNRRENPLSVAKFGTSDVVSPGNLLRCRFSPGEFRNTPFLPKVSAKAHRRASGQQEINLFNPYNQIAKEPAFLAAPRGTPPCDPYCILLFPCFVAPRPNYFQKSGKSYSRVLSKALGVLRGTAVRNHQQIFRTNSDTWECSRAKSRLASPGILCMGPPIPPPQLNGAYPDAKQPILGSPPRK